jgi:RNA polymerase sigma-70 factor (ECF subfamily)
MNGSDGDLVRAVQGGRRLAYDELVRRHAAKISAVCRSRLGSRGPVEDMVQEAFLRGFRALGTLAEPDKFASWVYGIATRACLDWLKSKERSQVSFDALGPGADAGQVRSPERSEDPDRHARLLEVIDALPETYREVVLMFYYKKQSYQEMSEILDLSPAAINARLTKARAMLRERLAGALGP